MKKTKTIFNSLQTSFIVKTITGVFVFCLATASHATVRTCSNDLAGGAQYISLQAVYNASTNGDTILLEGTNVSYLIGNDWVKQLVVIGIGFNPTKSNPRHAIISQISVTSSRIGLTTAGNGSVFYGIDFNYVGNSIILTSAISNYSFEDCIFWNTVDFSSFTSNTITFRNCVFGTTNTTDILFASTLQATNIMFLSCVFSGLINGSSNPSNTITVDHCMFLATTSNSIFSVQNAVVKNSMFMNFTNIANAASVNNTFSNNISRLNTTYPPAGNLGSGNITNTDPMLVTFTAGQTYSFAHNYALQAGSPCIGAGLLGVDIGPHGSGSHYNESGEVLINPIVRTVNIGNTNVAPNGNLNIQINATKPNDQ